MNKSFIGAALIGAVAAVAVNADARIARSALAFRSLFTSYAPYVRYDSAGLWVDGDALDAAKINITGIGVMASADRDPSVAGVGIAVDGFGVGVQPTFVSVDYQGNLLTSDKYGTSYATGAWEFNETFTAAQAPKWSYASVFCGVPKSYGKAIYITGVTTY